MQILGEVFSVWSEKSATGKFDNWTITRVKTGKNIGGSMSIVLDPQRQGLYMENYKELMDQATERVVKHLEGVAKRSKGRK